MSLPNFAGEDAGDYHKQRLADGQTCLEAALAYLARGWSVLPLCPPDHVGVGRGHDCDSPGKRPLVPWKEFQDRLPTEREVRDWWRHWPNANLGVALDRLVKHRYLRTAQPERQGNVGRRPDLVYEVSPLWDRRENRVNRGNDTGADPTSHSEVYSSDLPDLPDGGVSEDFQPQIWTPFD
jgi:hypothetical protein